MGRELVRQLVAEGCNVAMCDVSAEAMAETKGLCETEKLPQGLRITTHIAESSEEYAMFAESSGELHDFLKQLGRPMTDCGATSPLRHLIENRLIAPDCIVAHLNELDDRDLEILSQAEWRNLQIVHCPKSHRFLHQKRFPLEALKERGGRIISTLDHPAAARMAPWW